MAGEIIVRLTIVPKSRSPKHGAKFRAVTTGSVVYAAESRHGATCALAREMVAAGVPDAPMIVHEDDRITPSLTIASFHRHAKRTYSEPADRPLHMRPYAEFPDAIPFAPATRFMGGDDEAG